MTKNITLLGIKFPVMVTKKKEDQTKMIRKLIEEQRIKSNSENPIDMEWFSRQHFKNATNISKLDVSYMTGELLPEIEEPMKYAEWLKGSDMYLEKYFPIIKASELSLEDKFLQHKSETTNQKKLKKMIISLINSGIADFRVQRLEPAYSNSDIIYKLGAVRTIECCDWWIKKAQNFMPEKNSRLGSPEQRIAFLGVLIKELVDDYGYQIEMAWRQVCDFAENITYDQSPWLDANAVIPYGRISRERLISIQLCHRLGRFFDFSTAKTITFDYENNNLVVFTPVKLTLLHQLDVSSLVEFDVYDEYALEEGCYGKGWIVMDV